MSWSGRGPRAQTPQSAAYVAEILRAGLNSIRPGQIRAAKALGMSGVQVVAKVVLPQAVIRMLPALGSIVSVTIKDTAIDLLQGYSGMAPGGPFDRFICNF